MQEKPPISRQSHMKAVMTALLRQFVGPITSWGSFSELNFLSEDTCTFSVVLMMPLEKMNRAQLTTLLTKYKTSLAIDMVIRLDKETVIHSSPLDGSASFTKHDHVPTLKGESTQFESFMINQFMEESNIEELRSQSFIKQLYKNACDDIQHKFTLKFGPVLAGLIDDAGGKVSMQASENNPTCIDFNVSMSNACLYHLSLLTVSRKPNGFMLLDYAKILNMVLPPLKISDEHSWHPSNEPGYCFERIVTKAEYQYFHQEDQLRRGLGINFRALSSLKTRLGQDTLNHALAEISLSSIAQIIILAHLQPSRIIPAVREALDKEDVVYQIEHIGPLSFKLKLEPTDSVNSSNEDSENYSPEEPVNIMRLFETNPKIQAIKAHYQITISEREGDIYFKADRLVPAEVLAPKTSVPVAKDAKSPQKESSLSMQDKKDLITQLSAPKSQLSKSAIGALVFPLKITCENQEQLAVFKSKFVEVMSQELKCFSDNPKGLTLARVKELAEEIKAVNDPDALDDAPDDDSGDDWSTDSTERLSLKNI